MKFVSNLIFWRIYFTLAFFISLVSLFFLLKQTSESESAVFLGYSWPRLVLAGVIGLAIMCFLWLSKQVGRHPTTFHWDGYLEKWTSRHYLLGLGVFISILGLILGLPHFVAASKSGVFFFSHGYLIQMVPFTGWFFSLSLLWLIMLVGVRFATISKEPAKVKYQEASFILLLLLFILILTAGVYAHMHLWASTSSKSDLFSIYEEGKRLMSNENPYERVLSGNMENNEKYATYFPGFYYLAWLTQRIGLDELNVWVSFWEFIFLLFNLAIACVLFFFLYYRQMPVLAIFAALFWLFNRWSLFVTKSIQIDFIPILFLVLSVLTRPKNKPISYILLGLSLSIKQVAIFIVPLYLIWALVEEKNRAFLHTARAAIGIAAIPIISSLPFMVWNMEGFVKSILFSVTRSSLQAFGAPSIDDILGWSGVVAKLPLLGLLCLIYWLAGMRKIGTFSAVLLVLLTFVDFNAVLLPQYITLAVPFIPLAISELKQPIIQTSKSGTE